MSVLGTIMPCDARHCKLFDREFLMPLLVVSRLPFLLSTSKFTTPHMRKDLSFAVYAISSKFYTQLRELHQQLADLVQKHNFSVPVKWYKHLEIAQVYLFLTLWGCGAVERYEYDKTWLLLGMAIRSVSLCFFDSVYSVTSIIQDGKRTKSALEDINDQLRYARRLGSG